MDLKKYIYSHCVHPVKVKIWDAYSQQYIVRLVPCGKCLHCKNSHINEWCTRLIAQRKYSKFIYYVSLDYAPFTLSDPNALKLAKETAACYHNINKNSTYGMHPLILCKNHLQDFFKRLRKNTNVKIQYFSCGEYGMHANGRGYGRPHFHNIIFSNEPITEQDFIDAWTINGYKIGRVDYKDMTALELGDNDSIKIFKYVCKYLQKSDFDFSRLATIEFHRTYFKSMCQVIEQQTDLFSCPRFSYNENTKEDGFTWRDYIKNFSPFVVCSRRPSIGAAYFADNLERFKEQDFRLFGLPKECSAFPRYYVRRTKESLYPTFAIGRDSKKPTSSSRMGSIFQVLSYMQNDRLDFSHFGEESTNPWCICKSEGGELCVKFRDTDNLIKCCDLSFYDNQNKLFYQFDGYHYNVWAKLKKSYSLLCNMDIYAILKEFYPYWDGFWRTYLKPMHDKRILSEKEFDDSVKALYGDYDAFYDAVYASYKVELDSIYKKNLLMQNSKQNL